jgi:hypothetical protein
MGAPFLGRIMVNNLVASRQQPASLSDTDDGVKADAAGRMLADRPLRRRVQIGAMRQRSPTTSRASAPRCPLRRRPGRGQSGWCGPASAPACSRHPRPGRHRHRRSGAPGTRTDRDRAREGTRSRSTVSRMWASRPRRRSSAPKPPHTAAGSNATPISSDGAGSGRDAGVFGRATSTTSSPGAPCHPGDAPPSECDTAPSQPGHPLQSPSPKLGPWRVCPAVGAVCP